MSEYFWPFSYEKLSFLLWVAFATVLPFSIAIATGFLIAIIVFFFLHLAGTRDFSSLKPSSPLEWSVLVFLGWVVFSTFFSTNFARSIDGLRTEYVALILFILPRTIRTDEQARWLAIAFSIATTLIAVLCLKQYSDTDYMAAHGWPFGTRSNRLTNAEGLLLALGLVLPSLRTFRSKWALGKWLFFLILLGGLLATNCRGPWVALLIMVIAFELTNFKRVPLISLFLIAFVLGMSSRTDYSLSRRVRSIIDTQNNISNQDRLYMWKIGSKMLQARPLFGYGLKTIGENFRDFELRSGIADPKAWGEVHNSFLQVAVQHGIMGLVLYLGIFAAAFKTFWRNRRCTLCQGVTLGVVGFLAAGFTESIYNDSEIAMMFYLFLGILSFMDKGKPQQDEMARSV